MEEFVDFACGWGEWSIDRIELRRSDSSGQSGDLGRVRRRRHAETVKRK